MRSRYTALLALASVFGALSLTACSPSTNMSSMPSLADYAVSPPAEDAPHGLMPYTAALNLEESTVPMHATVFYPEEWQEIEVEDLGAIVPQDNIIITSFVGPNGETLILELVAPHVEDVVEVSSVPGSGSTTRLGSMSDEVIDNSQNEDDLTSMSQASGLSRHSKTYEFDGVTIAITLVTALPSDVTPEQLEYIVNNVLWN